MAASRALSRHRTLYRALLVLYPRSFRAEYSDAMTQVFADRFRDVGPRVWLRTIPDLTTSVPTERIEATMKHLGPTARVFALLFVVLGAVSVSVGLGGGAVPVLAIAVLGIVFTQRRLLASSFGERAPLGRAVIQAWWAPIAGLLGVAMMFFAVGTFFEAHNLAGRIVGSTVMMAFGLTMLFGLMRRPFHRRAGNSMILLATIPAFAFFWIIVPAVAAIAVWTGVLSGGFDEVPVASAA